MTAPEATDRTEQADYDGGCCALDVGHEGACAWICSECQGTQRCPECGDRSVDVWGGGCGDCGGVGGCHYCYEGLMADA